jgi:hypothetical protein
MSAFFVGDDCLTRCVTAILLYTDRFGGIETGNDIGRSTPILESELRAGNEIGRALRAMNIAALRVRYGNRLDAEETDGRYEFTGYSAPHLPPIHLYKALHCLHYQCSEGNVPETNPLHAELARVIKLMEAAERVSTRHPGWGQAAWGG